MFHVSQLIMVELLASFVIFSLPMKQSVTTYLSPKEAAAQLHLHTQTIYKYLRTGIVKGKQFQKEGRWRVPVSEVKRIKEEMGDA